MTKRKILKMNFNCCGGILLSLACCLLLFGCGTGGSFVAPTQYPLATPHHPAWPNPSANNPPPSNTDPDVEDSDGPPAPVPGDPFMDEVTSFQAGPYAGYGQADFPEIVLGGPQGKGCCLGGTDVLSLGVGGIITLKSDTAVLDGPGPDFIVFENAFWAGANPQTPYAELGRVSVSQNNQQFFSFPCETNNPTELFPGCAGVSPVLANVLTNAIDPTDPEAAGGDAFDLADLDLDWVLYIRIEALSQGGGGDTAGFDLDAIAIVYQ
jgi:hypothetical protein